VLRWTLKEEEVHPWGCCTTPVLRRNRSTPDIYHSFLVVALDHLRTFAFPHDLIPTHTNNTLHDAFVPTVLRSSRSQHSIRSTSQHALPHPSLDQKLGIQLQAHGTLPNGPPPQKLSEEGRTNLKLIALNELFEVAFFTELVWNITNKVSGYELGYSNEYVLDTLKAIVAQEQLHLLNANGALEKFKEEPIKPCKYSFPVSDFQSAIGLAGLFTDLVLGTLQGKTFKPY
jgi:hypothetical protein